MTGLTGFQGWQSITPVDAALMRFLQELHAKVILIESKLCF